MKGHKTVRLGRAGSLSPTTWQSLLRLALGAVLMLATAAPPAASEPATHPVSGRILAPVMGVGGADWLVRPERQAEENPDLAVRLLGVKPGMVVADIGAGVGYYTERLARRVGPDGRVYATDIQAEMLRLLRRRLGRKDLANVEVVMGSEVETGLPDGQIDLALMVDVYHELAQPRLFLQNLKRALTPGGRLVLIEFRAEDPRVPIRPEHKLSIRTAKQELEAEGFELIEVKHELPWQHMLFFGIAGAGKAPAVAGQ